MVAFARAVFKAGQRTPLGVAVTEKSYLPSHTIVSSSLSELAEAYHTNFAKQLPFLLASVVGAISIDGVTLKLQSRHYIDFTLHHIEDAREKNFSSAPQFSIQTSTLLFLKSPDSATSVNLRNHLDNELRLHYGLDLDFIQRNCTVVTDGAAAMGRMANRSVSTRLKRHGERWMRCSVHVLNNCMKSVFKKG